jgi:uncharacterized damage-inducible protein DinB
MKTHFQQLFDYDYWAIKRLGTDMLTVSELPERPQCLYAHLLSANHIWQSRMSGGMPQLGVWENIPRNSWLSQMEQNRVQMLALLNVFSADDFEQNITYTTAKGISYQNTVTEILMHMIAHSNYHMGQINQLLKPFIPPVDVMYITFVREKHNLPNT